MFNYATLHRMGARQALNTLKEAREKAQERVNRAMDNRAHKVYEVRAEERYVYDELILLVEEHIDRLTQGL